MDAEQDMTERRANMTVSMDYLVKCAPCHNNDGSGPVGAVIAGMSKEELVQKLQSYKDGEQHNGLMDELMRRISYEEINKLAEEISNF
jgi:cytochrome c553